MRFQRNFWRGRHGICGITLGWLYIEAHRSSRGSLRDPSRGSNRVPLACTRGAYRVALVRWLLNLKADSSVRSLTVRRAHISFLCRAPTLDVLRGASMFYALGGAPMANVLCRAAVAKALCRVPMPNVLRLCGATVPKGFCLGRFSSLLGTAVLVCIWWSGWRSRRRHAPVVVDDCILFLTHQAVDCPCAPSLKLYPLRQLVTDIVRTVYCMPGCLQDLRANVYQAKQL
mmetsp:Transcript_1664/g.2905  ORF Transcript_1664/g.2905 Transcript_1664/m.2905 type:complete len:229 (-) Transcript_1664:113-799(-)